jgi:hypothetical protein
MPTQHVQPLPQHRHRLLLTCSAHRSLLHELTLLSFKDKINNCYCFILTIFQEVVRGWSGSPGRLRHKLDSEVDDILKQRAGARLIERFLQLAPVIDWCGALWETNSSQAILTRD